MPDTGTDYYPGQGAALAASALLTLLKTVDGAGSGLDADLIDGIDSTALGGTGGSTAVVVAAADSTAAAKAAALASGGVVCTGTAGFAVDDTLTIQAAASGGKPLAFMPGNYYFKTTLDGTAFGNVAYGIVPGKAIINLHNALVTGMQFFGAVSSGKATFTALAVKGSTTLSVGANTITNGQIFNIQTDQFFSDRGYVGSDYPEMKKGEWIQVASGGGTGTLTLKRALFDSYSMSSPPTLRLMTPVDRVAVDGLVFIGAGQTGAGVTPTGGVDQLALVVQYFTNAAVRNCGFYDLSDEGCRMRAGIGAMISGCYGERVSNLGFQGSVLIMLGVERGQFINNSGGDDSRHLIDVDGYNPDPPSRGVTITGNVSSNTYVSGINTHPGVDGCTMTANIGIRGGAGIMSRGPNAVITGNISMGPFTAQYPGAFTIGDGNDLTKNGRAGEALQFHNNTVIGNQTSAATPNVWGLYVYDSLYGARITSFRCSGVTQHQIALFGNQCYDSFIEGCIFDCTGQKANQDAICITPATVAAGNNQRSLVIRDNSITVAPTRNAVTITGPGSGTPSTAVDVAGNDFRGAAVSITGLVTAPNVRGNDGRAGVFATALTAFYVNNPPISQTNTRFTWPAGSTQVGLVMPYAGSIVGLGVWLTTARSAGTVSVTVYVNDVATALTVTINTNVNKNNALATAGTINFAAGDHINLRYTTDGTWAPTTNNIVPTIWTEQ